MEDKVCVAKFLCKSVTDYGNCQEAYFEPVCADEVPENERFHKWTPSGKLQITVNNPNVAFVPQKAYYLTFQEANQ